MGRRKLVDFSSMSSSLSKSANFQWMQRRRESLDVYSTPRGEKRADVENTRETENRCNRCWKDGGDVRRGGEVGTDEVEKGTKGNEENTGRREREEGARRREGRRRRRRKRIRIFTNHSARHLREENLLCLWKARKWRGLLSPGTRSLPRTCRKVRVKPLLHPSVPPRPATHRIQPSRRWGARGWKCIYYSLPGKERDRQGEPVASRF